MQLTTKTICSAIDVALYEMLGDMLADDTLADFIYRNLSDDMRGQITRDDFRAHLATLRDTDNEFLVSTTINHY